MRSRLLPLAAVVAGLLLVPACDSPSEPTNGERIPIGTVVTTSFGTDSVRVLSFEATAGEYAVFLESLRGTLGLRVIDSATSSQIADVLVSPTMPPDQNGTLSFPASAGQVFHLEVRAYPADSGGGTFRILVYRANPAPEHAPQRFVLGDTVNEVLDGIADVDDFLVAGQASDEFVAVAEALGPAGAGELSMIVFDSGASYPIVGYVVTPAGLPPSATTGRLRFIESRDYRFRFRTEALPPRYHGPYRFWSYRINRAPELLPATVPIDAIVTGEVIDRAGDVDEFTLDVPAGGEFNAFFQAGRAFQLAVALENNPALAAVAAEPDDTGMFRHATGRFGVPGGRYRVQVFGPSEAPVADTGAYRFFVYPIDRRPEQVAATITPGDTVSGEAIDLPGDVDEFTFAGAAGEQYNALFQVTTNTSSGTQMRLEAVDAGGNVLGVVHGDGADTSLFQHVTGRFTLPGAGVARLRVRGVSDQIARDIGPYRLVLIRVNRQPETQPATLAFGDSVFGEAIDVPGDIDEFRVVVPDTSASSLVVHLGPNATEGLRVQLVDSATGAVVREAAAGGPGAYGIAAGGPVAPGTYIVRVHDSNLENGQSLLRGPYTVWLYRYRFGPEVASDTIAIGDTVNVETLDPVADVDRFAFYGEWGQRINIAFQGTSSAVTGGFQAMLFASGNPALALTTLTRSDSPGGSQSTRIDLRYTGWYQIVVVGGASSLAMGDRGSYRLALTGLPVEPEQTAQALVLGDSVVSEQLDYPGDVDQYVLVAPPGQMVALVSRRPGVGLPRVLVSDSASSDTLVWAFVESEARARRFVMPASGRAHVAVYESHSFGFPNCSNPTCHDRYGLLGGFRLAVFAVDPAPETAAATITLGDTVTESLTPGTDLDEFTGTGVPGEEVSGWFRLDSLPPPSGNMIAFDVDDPVTGEVLRGGFAMFGVNEYHTSGTFRVPASGAFRLRVRGYTEVVATANYRFFFRR